MKFRGLLIITFIGLLIRLLIWWYYASDHLALVTQRLPDDALYYFTAARSFALGHGITYDGIDASNGLHPLWLLLMSPIFWLHLSKWGTINAVLLLQSLVDTITIWLLGVASMQLIKNRRSNDPTVLTAPVLYSLSPLVLTHSINGLETSLAGLLVVVWILVFTRWQLRSSTNWLLGATTGLLFLARTDLLIVIIPMLIYFVVRNRSELQFRAMMIASLAALIVVSPWLVWNVQTFGTILQSSAEAVPIFAMKKYEAIYGTAKYGYLLLEALKNSGKLFFYSSAGLGLLPLAYLTVRRRSRLSEPQKQIGLLLLGGVVLICIHSLFRGFIREWYVEQLIPLFLLGFGVSLAMVEGADPSAWRLRVPFLCLILILLGLTLKKPYESQAVIYAKGLPLIDSLSRHSKIGALNSGYDSYFAAHDGSIVNLDGVMNPDALRHIRAGSLGVYLREDSVDYVLDFKGDLGGYSGLIDRHMLDDFELDSRANGQQNSDLQLYRRRVGQNSSH